MKKTVSSISMTVLAITFAVGIAPQPVKAFDLQSSFTSITSGIQQQFRKMYLALPGDKSAEAVLEQTALAMQNISSVYSESEVSATLLEDENQVMSLMVKTQGTSIIEDIYQPSTARQDLHVSAELVMEGTVLNANADIKIDQETVYVRANQIPSIPFLQVGQLKDQWIVLDSASGNSIGSSELVLQGIDSDVSDESSTLTEDQKKELQSLYENFIKNAQLSSAKKETLDGDKVFTINATFTADDVAVFARKLAEIQDAADVQANSQADNQVDIPTDAQITAQTEKDLADLDQVLDQLEDVTITIMVDQSSYYLRKIVVPLLFTITDDAKNKQVSTQLQALGDFESADTLNVLVNVVFDKYNEPVDFVLPDDAVPASELFTNFGSTLPVGLPDGIGSSAGMSGFEALESGGSNDLPAELQNVSDEEKEILKQYGVDLNAL